MSHSEPAAQSFSLAPQTVQTAVRSALAEDLGLLGDLTTNATIPAGHKAVCHIAARQAGIIAGLELAREAFHQVDKTCTFTPQLADGDPVEPGAIVARVAGPARALLTAERVALNFMGRLSGIASLTRAYVDAVDGTGASIADTRKTTPGLRALEKYAVRIGGGMNHRAGLYDAVLIKDNHIAIAGGVTPAIEAARAGVGHMVKIEIEVDTLEQLADILAHARKIDAVLLDNMTPQQLSQAVELVDGRLITEASGGVSLKTVRAIAQSGVDLISIGALTHSAPVLDLGFDFESRATT